MMCCIWSFLWFVFEWILQISIKPFKNSLVPTPYAHGHIRQQLNASLPVAQCQPAAPARRAGRAGGGAGRERSTHRSHT